jgi:hypothetical protein
MLYEPGGLSSYTSCHISGFHGSDYEESRLLGYRNTDSTSQETHYISATEQPFNAM